MNLDARASIHAALGNPLRLAVVDALMLGDLTPGELSRRLGAEGNLLAHHLGVLEGAGVVRRKVSEGDGRRRYVVLQREVLGSVGVSRRLSAGSLLFVCTRNSARSQMAEALLVSRSDLLVESAGTEPAPRVHPKAVRVAREHGIDLSGVTPRHFKEVARLPDLVVTVCDEAREAEVPFDCERVHWSVPDPVPAGTMEMFRSAFAEIRRRVDGLIGAIDHGDKESERT